LLSASRNTTTAMTEKTSLATPQMTSQRSVEGIWRGGLRCDVAAQTFVIVVDEPKSVGGTDSGPQPTDFFLASIASCFALAVAYSARKQSIELDSLSVTVTGAYDGPRFRAINIVSRLGCNPAEVEKLVRAAERICYVTNTLRSDVDIAVVASAVST
jgi:putative redox protein